MAAGLAASLGPAQARIVRLEVLRTEPAFGGQAFGSAGGYEKIVARAYGEVDPADPGNAIIQDLNLAPRNARGLVAYATEVELLKPVDAGRGNGVLLFEAVNRGNKLAPSFFHTGIAGGIAERNALTSPGDGYLFREGYTLVWWGWQMNVRPGLNRLAMSEIVARQPDGSPVSGVVRSEIVTPAATPTLPIGLSQQIQGYPPDSYASYPAASLDNGAAAADGFLPTLTVRAMEESP